MTGTTPAEIRRPRTDERCLWDIMCRVYGGQAFFVALELKLFPLLAEEPRTVNRARTT